MTGPCGVARRARLVFGLTAALTAAAGVAMMTGGGAAPAERAGPRSFYRLVGGPLPAPASPVSAVPAGAYFQPPNLHFARPEAPHGD